MPTRETGRVASFSPPYMRSANLEQDFLGLPPIQVLSTHSVRSCLSLLLRGTDDAVCRAQLLTGAYGSGKSTIALALARLLDTRTRAEDRNSLVRGLELSDTVRRLGDKAGKYHVVVVSARKESLGACLARAVRLSYSGQEATLSSSGWSRYSRGSRDAVQPSDGVGLVEALGSLARETCKQTGVCGLIVVIDELGQIIDHATEHPESGDLQLLQVLAEAAVRSASPEFWLLGVLHEEPAELFGRLGRRGRDQWRKVEQRFMEVACVPSLEDTVRLVARAVSRERTRTRVPQAARNIIDTCQDLCPTGMAPQAFRSLCLEAYPLHPSVLLAVPLLSQQFGQSRRSAVSFVSAPEPGGFRAWAAAASHSDGTLYGLADLFDYVCTVLPMRRAADTTGTSVMLDAHEILSRLGRERGADASVVKVIAIMDLIGGASGLMPSLRVLKMALTGASLRAGEVAESVRRLEAERRIVFRPIVDRYHLWQGSDINLLERYSAAGRALGLAWDVTETVQRLEPPKAIAARRHSFETGTFRVVPSRLVAAKRLALELEHAPKTGIVFYCLAASAEELAQVCDTLGDYSADNVLGVVARDSEALVRSAREVAVVGWIAAHTPDLSGDRAARRELAERTQEATIRLRQSWTHAFSPEGKAVVYWHGSPTQVNSAKTLRSLASDMCDAIYVLGPRVRNELLNTDALSSQAAAARRSLAEHMLTSEPEPLLGIQGYPPERSMYECVLRETGIHRRSPSGNWFFGAPSKDDPCRMSPSWLFMAQMLQEGAPMQQVKVSNILETLHSPPYGLTRGLASVLTIAFILGSEGQVSVYENGIFSTHLSVPLFELMLKSPESFSLSWCTVEGMRKDVVDRLARGLGVKVGVVPVVRGLLSRISALPSYSLHTHQIELGSQKLREALLSARSPEAFLFSELPTALGCDPIPGVDHDKVVSEREIATFFGRLNSGLTELGEVYRDLLESIKSILLDVFGVSDSSDHWREVIASRAAKWMQVTADAHMRVVFVHAQDSRADDDAYLESLAAALTGLSPKEWMDEHVNDFRRQTLSLHIAVKEAESRLLLDERLGGKSGLLLELHDTTGLSETLVVNTSDLDHEKVVTAAAAIRNIVADLEDRDRKAALAGVLADVIGKSDPSGRRRKR
jgi:energy-coupling factor transporter ATP-binding protein EcfA2